MSARDRLLDLLVPVPDASSPAARAARLRQSLQMADDGIRMMRQNLRRRNPCASDAEIERLLTAWLQDRPADAWGRAAPERFPDL